MNKSILIFVLSLLAHIIYAQKLSVESFVVAADNDMTAQSNERLDTNGKKCAVVKVRVALDGLKFDGAIQGETIHRMGEYWVYMPANASELHVYHDKYIPTDINFHDYSIGRVKSGVTYVLTLAKPSTATAEQQTQTLTIRYAPTSAMVLVDNKLVNSSNGMASVSLPIGQHSYIVACKGYDVRGHGKAEGFGSQQPADYSLEGKSADTTNGSSCSGEQLFFVRQYDHHSHQRRH